MSLCVAVNNGAVVIDATCQFLLLTQEEVNKLTSQPTLVDLLQFDSSMYEFLLGYMLLSFIAGHVAGRIIKTFGKV